MRFVAEECLFRQLIRNRIEFKMKEMTAKQLYYHELDYDRLKRIQEYLSLRKTRDEHG